jgi:hypothetical protein
MLLNTAPSSFLSKMPSGCAPVLSGEDLARVIQICRLVRCPQALEAWMRMLSPAEIAAQLATHRLDFLEAEWHDVPERQRSMRAVFDYSWRLLSERERQVLAQLSVFRGGFTYPAAQQVAIVEGATATLRDLMDWSTLHVTHPWADTRCMNCCGNTPRRLHQSPDGCDAVRDNKWSTLRLPCASRH